MKRKEYLPLGEGKGVVIILKNNGITLQRRERNNKKWSVTQEIFLSKPILEKLFVRIPVYFLHFYNNKNDI